MTFAVSCCFPAAAAGLSWTVTSQTARYRDAAPRPAPARTGHQIGHSLIAAAQFLNACRATQTGIYITTHGRLYDMANGRDWRSLAEDGVDSACESEKTFVRTFATAWHTASSRSAAVMPGRGATIASGSRGLVPSRRSRVWKWTAPRAWYSAALPCDSRTGGRI
jgi:hypothetical protein